MGITLAFNNEFFKDGLYQGHRADDARTHPGPATLGHFFYPKKRTE